MSHRTLMSYLVLSRNGEESFNKFLSPDPDPGLDHLGRGANHGYSLRKNNQVRIVVFELRWHKITFMKYKFIHLPPRCKM